MWVTAASKIRNQPLHPAAEKGVENHRRNADGEAGRCIDQRLADSSREQCITSCAQVRAERAKRSDDADDGAEQTEHRRDHSDVGKISDAIVEIGRDARAFCFRDLANLAKIGVGILGGKIEHLLHDARDRFAMSLETASNPR